MMTERINNVDNTAPAVEVHTQSVVAGSETSGNAVGTATQARAELASTLAATPENPRKKRGAQVGNANAVKHGARGFPRRFTGPAGSDYRRKLLGQLLERVEAEALAAKGEITVTTAGLIQSVATHEWRRALLHLWVSGEGSQMKPETRLAYLEAIGRASDARDRALKLLDLDAGDSPLDLAALKARHFATLDAMAAMPRHVAQIEPGSDATTPSTERASTTQNALDEATGALNDGALTNAESARDEPD
jgi:hypothetical protein